METRELLRVPHKLHYQTPNLKYKIIAPHFYIISWRDVNCEESHTNYITNLLM